MFVNKYVSDLYFSLIIYNYDINYLNTLNEDNFIKINNLFKEYNFYFIEDIILNYLEIFSFEYNKVLKGIISLKETLGDNFVNIIGNDMKYLDTLYKLNEEI